MIPPRVTLIPVELEFRRKSITRADYKRILDTKTIEWLLEQINTPLFPISLTIYHVIDAIKAWAKEDFEDGFNNLFAELTGTTGAGELFHYGLQFFRFKWGTEIRINRVFLVREWGSSIRPIPGSNSADFILVPVFEL